ncbi:F-box protein At2g26850-like isoform X1 [Rhodamnia argentea]|uniref:F-box protein At2g26850-like isoform X1 n=1 Tax=Rhodamnia argentea TaxID=178133 RepID=A0A8B8NC64_9MYRT|nr:F-box protein At2g26850-like isoform X1 [Rhodamnia argentea]
MLLFFVSCFSFILISRSMSCKPLLPLRNQLTLLSPFPWGQFSSFLMSFFRRIKLNQVLVMKPLKKMTTGPSQVLQVEDFPGEAKVSLLDLPELTLDYILERLSPAGLCSMAEVCSSMREKCRSDHLWEKHMKQKWNRLIGDAATREWQCQLASRKRPSLYGLDRRKGFDKDLLFSVWPFTWMRPNLEGRSNQPRSAFPVDSIMGLYLSLENGKFWFPAQVYNRENGHSGFMLSCYDAHVSYDSQTDTFQARYLSHGRRTVEENIPWDRLRAPPISTPPHDLHNSDCINDLRPGNHIEIQWRKSKEFPYGWWYGVVGHLESCDGNEDRCRCHYSDNVILEFNQYPADSRWRRTVINRREHREAGTEGNGFYGGIRKLSTNEEISTWKRLWPAHVME